MLVLGIESSCDECAAAVVENGTIVLGQEISSQVTIHSPFGGVVPELASRDHIRKLIPVIDQALKKAGARLQDIQGIAVTAGPGLIGSLLVGVCAAKTLAWCLDLPLVGVNHLEAHLHATFLERPCPYPHLGLVVSGGHTSLFRVEGLGQLKLLGRTLDDAAGEAFDKVAKLLGLSYPGGVSIEQACRGGDPEAIRFPRPMPDKKNLNFSFSGLKTSVAVRVKQEGIPEGEALKDFTASFQEAVVDSLCKKTLAAARKEKLTRIVIAGGVAANRRLREEITRRASEFDLEVLIPSTALCTDNAAMVGTLGGAYLESGRNDGFSLDANAGLRWHDV